jgi:pyruvate dehydrogenase E2 component (dihydrolipoamide acetyltransferase)
MTTTREITVPDIGDFKDIPVIEILVKPGDTVKAEDSLVVLESDKATMDVPSPAAGTVQSINVKLGDRVSQGSVIVTLAAGEASAPAKVASLPPEAAASVPQPTQVKAVVPGIASAPQAYVVAPPASGESTRKAHATPSIRLFARELGVDLSRVPGTGFKGRIQREDVQNFVKGVMARTQSDAVTPSGGVGFNVLPWPKIDFAKFGPVDSKPLSRIRKIAGANLHRNWVMIPHVTNHEEADITDLEAFRVELNKELGKGDTVVSMLAFLVKACAAALRKFPNFNASLDGDNLVLKHYCHIGFAADTPDGLVVPVIRNADQKGVGEIAKEIFDLARLARDGKLKAEQMQGGCFSISSLGGIGGTFFTPIINAPEVAILGVCKSFMKPVWDGKAFVPQLTLPLSLSWDHRVIDGADAARFNVYLVQLLADMRRTLV